MPPPVNSVCAVLSVGAWFAYFYVYAESKGRSKWHALWCLFPLVGWVVLWALRDRSAAPAVPQS